MQGMESDVPVMTRYLSQINSQLEKVREHAALLKQHVDSQKFGAKEGVDLLGLKNQLLLSYMVGLSNVVMVKTQGVRDSLLSQQQVVDRLVETRTVLEKMRPLEAKFSYQLDKLLRTASTGMTGGQHPLQFRPAPHNLVSKVQQEQGGTLGHGVSDSEEEDGGGVGVYVPPRVLAVPYKEEKQLHTQPRSRSEDHKLLSELRNEWSEFPAEVQTYEEGARQSSGLGKDKAKAREKFEEEYMVRLSSRGSHGGGGHKRLQQQVENQLTNFSLLRGLTKQVRSDVTRKKRKGFKRRGG